MTFGSVATSRIADPSNPTKIYAWFLDEEQDMFGHSIRYSYTQDGGQPYITDIYYGYTTSDTDPMYQIHFDYSTK